MELEHFITRERVEWAYREAKLAQMRRKQSWYDQAWRAAKARDSKLLLALQRGAEILQQMSEEQAGPHGFDVAGYRVQHTEYQMWKNAYVGADKGTPEENYAWIYLAAAILAGLVY